MSQDSQTLTHCPACKAEIIEDPIFGNYKTYTCPNHRKFSISLTAIAMMHANPSYSDTIGNRIANARGDEDQVMITSVDLQ
ncbi:hypothetical protein [Serratia marcescens]|uniref:hypothetical protein n=1 Tax=Serratia TaxID=613 RepID=UPI00217BAD12|nr:hypothetical protein [Serratia marcescens]CAI2022843.1 Uncharacterised protein [Serratia marcescens]HDT6550596.1 hypothetical protein [Serratia marcescens]